MSAKEKELDVIAKMRFPGRDAIFYLLLFFTPQSPRWLIAKGRTSEARKVFQRCGVDAGSVDRITGNAGALARTNVRSTLAFVVRVRIFRAARSAADKGVRTPSSKILVTSTPRPTKVD